MQGFSSVLVALSLILLMVGCGGSQRSSEPTPSPTDTHATPLATSTAQIERGSSGSSGSGSSGSSTGSRGGQDRAPTHASGGSDSGSQPDGVNKTPEPPPLSPSEWRKQNFKPRPFTDFADLKGYDEVRALTPQPADQTTIKSGKKLYSQACVACHNLDGSPVRRDPALLQYNMADLSRPHQYRYGSGPKAVFRSIRFGLPSPPMGFTGSIYSRTEVWDMVNYIQSIQRRR